MEILCDSRADLSYHDAEREEEGSEACADTKHEAHSFAGRSD